VGSVLAPLIYCKLDHSLHGPSMQVGHFLWNRLTPDVCTHIFKFIGVLNVVLRSDVCSAWNVAAHYPNVMKFMSFSATYLKRRRMNINQFGAVADIIGKKLQHLDIQQVDFELADLLKYFEFPQLRTLTYADDNYHKPSASCTDASWMMRSFDWVLRHLHPVCKQFIARHFNTFVHSHIDKSNIDQCCVVALRADYADQIFGVAQIAAIFNKITGVAESSKFATQVQTRLVSLLDVHVWPHDQSGVAKSLSSVLIDLPTATQTSPSDWPLIGNSIIVAYDRRCAYGVSKWFIIGLCYNNWFRYEYKRPVRHLLHS